MTGPSTDQGKITDLSARLSGMLLRPGDAGYDEVRRLHNGLIDKRPALIARCRGTADIAHAVNFARANGLELAVRGGGHNVSGRAVCNGGLMVDVSLMKGIHMDLPRRTARAQGGVTWREIAPQAQPLGPAPHGVARQEAPILGGPRADRGFSLAHQHGGLVC